MTKIKKLALTLPGGQIINSPTPQYNNLGQVLSGVFNVIFYLAFFLMFFWMAWGVFQYIFAGGEKDKLGKARSRITWAIVGFILIAIAFVLKDYLEGIFPQSLPGGVTNITRPQ